MSKKTAYKGSGIGDVLRSAKAFAKNTVNKVQTKIENMIPSTTKYTNNAQDSINKYGKYQIIEIVATKTPVIGAVMALSNALTLNELQVAMDREGIDTFYHMALRVKVLDQSGNTITLLLEKNENINIRLFKQDDIGPKTTLLNIDIGAQKFTLSEGLERILCLVILIHYFYIKQTVKNASLRWTI